MARASSANRSRTLRRVGGCEELAREVASLSAFDAETLRKTWANAFGAEPSPQIGRSLMVRALAYRLQERALGGLKPSTRRLLDRIANGSTIDPERIPSGRASAGTVLIREWRGVSHRVTVLDHDVVYRGRRYQSLSEVARVITGTRWSGPLFFGLRRRAKELAGG
jgi:hypothetical protein